MEVAPNEAYKWPLSQLEVGVGTPPGETYWLYIVLANILMTIGIFIEFMQKIANFICNLKKELCWWFGKKNLKKNIFHISIYSKST